MIYKHCGVTINDLSLVKSSISCSDSSPCKSCVEVENLENAIARLEMKQYELKRIINRVHCPFIRLIPPEIIARISGFAITGFTIIGSLPDAILLSSVCSDWRRAVVGTPELWSSIKIDLPSTSQTPEMASNTLPRLATFIDEWLSRSGQLPLNISLFYGHHGKISSDGDHDENPSDPLTLEQYRPIFNILDQYSSRWRSLNIFIPPTLLQFLQRPDCLPMLEQLHIGSSMNDPCHIISFPRAPCLTTVEIQQFTTFKSPISPYIGIHWDTVTHLSMKSISRDSVFEILLLNPQLVHITLRKICSDDSTEINPFLESPIVSSLTYLSLHHNIDASQILDCISLPCLETLVFENITTDSDPVISFLERSACSLHTLALRNWDDKKTDKFFPLLQFLSPSLRRLAISRKPSTIIGTKNHLSLLTRVYKSQSEAVGNGFLPHLEFFEYREESSPKSPGPSMLSNLPLASWDYTNLATSIPLRSVYISIASTIDMNIIPQNISIILQRLKEDGILTCNRI